MKILARWKTQLLLLLAALGPGFITANVDNDAGGIFTYSFAGARFGYSLLWTLIPMMIALTFAQEIAARMGVVTGKGLGELIREHYGLRITFLVMVALILVNFGNVVAEFAGVASSVQLFHVSKYISVPLAALFVWVLVVFGNYRRTEKIFLFASFLYIAYIATGVLAHPDWGEAARRVATPPSVRELTNSTYLYLAIGIIGATIAPWQQFYLQASIVEKRLPEQGLRLSQLDAIVGSIFSVIIAGFIILATAATLFVYGQHDIQTAADAAQALRPLAGEYAFLLFAVGLLNASLFAASILPLSTAYTVCEALGFEAGLNKKFSDARIFYWLYTLLVALGAALVLIPGVPLLRVAVFSQVINGVLLPFVLIFMLLLVNKPELMGRYVNTRLGNIIGWTMTLTITALTIAMVWSGR